MDRQYSEVKISILKLLGIFSTLIITSASITAGILVFFVINVDKNKIEELNQKIIEMKSEKKFFEDRVSKINDDFKEKVKDYEDRIFKINNNFDEKVKEAIKLEKESFDKSISDISEDYAEKFRIKVKEVASLQAKLKTQKMNEKCISKSQELLNDKGNLIRQYKENTSILQQINKSLASYEASCVDPERLPSGWHIYDNRGYW